MTTPGFPKADSEGSQDNVHHDHVHIDIPLKKPEKIEKVEHTYQHFQDHGKVYKFDPQKNTDPIHNTLYP